MTEEEAKELINPLMNGKNIFKVEPIKRFSLIDSSKYQTTSLNQATNNVKLEQNTERY